MTSQGPFLLSGLKSLQRTSITTIVRTPFCLTPEVGCWISAEGHHFSKTQLATPHLFSVICLLRPGFLEVLAKPEYDLPIVPSLCGGGGPSGAGGSPVVRPVSI